VLLLDEPLGALDLKLREEMQLELKRIQHEVGITFVFVTHDQGEALSMSTRVAVFNHGRVEQVGTPRDVYDHPTTDFVAAFVGTSNLLDPALSERLLGLARPHILRPERITLLPTGGEAPGLDVVVDGTVADVQYLGPECKVRVDLGHGTHLLASTPSDGLAGVGPGDGVRLGWARSAATTVNDSRKAPTP
jgi:putative spermidine/putrescine transport system ATP-binding protein